MGQIGEPSGFAVGRESELRGLFVVALLPQWRVSSVCCSLSGGLVLFVAPMLFVCGSFWVNIRCIYAINGMFVETLLLSSVL